MQKEDTKNAQIGLIYPIVQEMCRRYPHRGSEDLAQDVAVKLLKYQRRLPRKPRRGWISAVVRNAAIDRSRELKREREIFDPMVAVDSDGEMAEGTNGKIYFAHAVYPEQEADGITMEAIRAAFEALPETQREVLHLHCDGRSYSEISAITGTNIGTVRSRLHYGKSKPGSTSAWLRTGLSACKCRDDCI